MCYGAVVVSPELSDFPNGTSFFTAVDPRPRDFIFHSWCRHGSDVSDIKPSGCGSVRHNITPLGVVLRFVPVALISVTTVGNCPRGLWLLLALNNGPIPSALPQSHDQSGMA